MEEGVKEMVEDGVEEFIDERVDALVEGFAMLEGSVVEDILLDEDIVAEEKLLEDIMDGEIVVDENIVDESVVDESLLEAIVEPSTDDESVAFDDETTEAEEAIGDTLPGDITLEDRAVRVKLADDSLPDASSAVEETTVVEEA